MGVLAKRKERKQSELATVIGESVKAAMTANLPPGATITPANLLPNSTTPTGPYGQFPAMAEALMRNGATFGAPMGPGVPLYPVPLDRAEPGTTRPGMRRYQFDISQNLNINQRLALWRTLRGAAESIDVISRCIQIRTADVLRMDLDFGVSQDAISNIMATDNVSASEASKTARKLFGPEVDRMKRIWENPFPEDNRSLSEFISEMMWQLLVYDGLAITPAFNRGAECIGLEIVDTPTILLLLDNYGRRPLPPAPAFQQVLWGYVRSEAIGNPQKGKTFADGGATYDITESDVLSYFVLNPRTTTPYGWSPTEKSLPIANLYAERQKWLISEFKAGTTAKLYWRTDDSSITLQNFSTVERMINEGLAGMTEARYQTKLAPPGLIDPYEPKTVEEIYRADYDEHWLKQMASHYNLQPSQLGVIARAGLGGGKGSSEGEADMAESLSSKPQNRQLEDIFNSLSRQHFGCDRNVVASLKDDEGSEDQLEQANAFKILSDSAFMTSNEGREKLGLSLSSEPEADELAYLTPTGPIFLKGLIDAQATQQEQAANPPEPKAPIIMNAPKEGESDDSQQTDVPSDDQKPGETKDSQSLNGKEGEASKAALIEIGKFSKFVDTQAKRGKWRPFEFNDVPLETAQKLNDAAYFIVKGVSALPDNFETWASETAGLAPLGKARKPHKAQAKVRAIADNHTPKIAKALILTGVAKAVSGAVDHAKDMNHLLDEGSAKDIAMTYAKQTGIDTKALQLRLVALYQEAGKEAQDQFIQQTGKAVGSVDLAGLLDKANITIKGINDTAQDRVITAVKDGLLNGKSTSQIAADIQATVEGPMRLGQADMIARTETARAYGNVFVDQLAQAGYATWDWVTEGGNPCPVCIEMEENNPYPVATQFAPAHPNCECAPEVVGS